MTKANGTAILVAGAIGMIGATALITQFGGRLTTPKLVAPAYAATSNEGKCRPGSKFGIGGANWTIAAPGRIEPKGGEIRIWSQSLGQIAEIEVGVGAKVEAGQLLIKLADDEQRGNLAAAEADAASARAALSQAGSTLSHDRADVRDADDKVFQAEQDLMSAQLALDAEVARSDKAGSKSTDAQRHYDDARSRLGAANRTLAVALSKRLPEPSQAETVLAKARAMVAIARAQFEKTRIRAKSAGTVFEIDAKPGEVVAPSPETAPLMTIGDLTALRVVAEVDEADIANVAVGGSALVCLRGDNGNEYVGKVSRVAQYLGTMRLPRGPLRPTDLEVLRVWVELETSPNLKPGMRTEVYFQ